MGGLSADRTGMSISPPKHVIAGLDPAIQKARYAPSIFTRISRVPAELARLVFLKRDAASRLLDPRIKSGGDNSGEMRP
ncbi:MAG: hypothetical protein CVT72_01055 [Alphaproteobacteria bacterium HGW-Alphaproteobacteria-11]|nr:MAG: hypothetical protein CVT72_01055 [Alphaproteobacteria bacterium HGW-Alphaproteobacteria-11]